MKLVVYGSYDKPMWAYEGTADAWADENTGYLTITRKASVERQTIGQHARGEWVCWRYED